jgi:hypothetical protein
MKNLQSSSDWNVSDANVFWGEIAPTEHVVQIYENDEVFLNLLESFVTNGFIAGDCVVIIATKDHIELLNHRLANTGENVDALMADDLYIPLDAEQTLAEFMVNGWPDAKLFHQTINSIIGRARQKNRHVRAFGEMVAILWANGFSGATVHLENLWNRVCVTEAFCLFCAYPKSGFVQDAASSMHTICCAHSKMISGDYDQKSQIRYKTVLRPAG